MTVAEGTAVQGTLLKVISEAALDTDLPVIATEAATGRLHADLTIGARTFGVDDLRANAGLSCNGMMLAGQGFKISAAERDVLIRADGEKATEVIRPHVGGSELLRRALGEYVIDFFD